MAWGGAEVGGAEEEGEVDGRVVEGVGVDVDVFEDCCSKRPGDLFSRNSIACK
jgi:hypothetical protein